MAKMTETEALNLLVGATALIAQLAVLVPALAQNLAAIKDGLDDDSADDLNAKIVTAHAEVQVLNDRLQALRLPDA